MSPVRYRGISEHDPGPQHGYACRGPDYDHASHDCHAHRACHDDDDDGDGDDGDQDPQRCPSRTNHLEVSPICLSVWHFQMTTSSKCHCLNHGATHMRQGVVVLDLQCAQVPGILAQTTLPFASSPMPPAPNDIEFFSFKNWFHANTVNLTFVSPEKPLYAPLAMPVAGLSCWYLTKRKNIVTPNVHTFIVTQSTDISIQIIQTEDFINRAQKSTKPVTALGTRKDQIRFPVCQFGGSVSFLLPGDFLQVVLRVEQGVHVTNAFHTPSEEN